MSNESRIYEHECPCEFLKAFEDKTEKRFEKVESDINSSSGKIQDIEVTLAKINVKLNGILWGLGVIGASIIGVLVKYVASL